MITSEVSPADVTPVPTGASDVAPEGTPTHATADGHPGPGINREQLLVEGVKPEDST